MSSEKRKNKCIVICGPTASGKSDLAITLAQELGGEIINADSMQIYKELEILTSRPDRDDLKTVPHKLFGIRKIINPCSVSIWDNLAQKAIENAVSRGCVPIVCGGTGMYIKYLSTKLATVPNIPADVRLMTREKLMKLGNEKFYQELVKLDPQMEGKIPLGDSQRLVRAWEVFEVTGKSVFTWQAVTPSKTDLTVCNILLMPDREFLYASCDRRFLGFVDKGALNEAKTIRDLELDPSLPGMKALGLLQLIDYLEGKINLDAAIERAQQKTRNYAKRQMTWFRNQLNSDYTDHSPHTGRHISDILQMVIKFLKA
ncbi:MAG: tRNA (adenosine(37)-N6)-dimethylallyltransferase MiaA [Rhodospirillaceae bacterium]|nr:tRNA (adenosine(37)-N6)-dimethylallyltransferase MiaA [Rhodospirillaceae bacterium]